MQTSLPCKGEAVNDEYQFDDMILSVCQPFIKTRSILKLKEQIAHYQDHLRLQITELRDENENLRASKTEESAKD